MARMDMNNPAEIAGPISDKELELMEAGVDGVNPTMPVRGDEGAMPMMSDEEKKIYMDLLNRGIPDDMIIEIMATAKLGDAIGGAATASINPTEFGGLPMSGSSPASGNPSIPTVGGSGAAGGAMSNQDMAMYLQNKVNEIRDRTGGSTGMGALGGVAKPPMPMPRPFDVSGMSAPQKQMVRKGVDPFAEGMMGRK